MYLEIRQFGPLFNSSAPGSSFRRLPSQNRLATDYSLTTGDRINASSAVCDDEKRCYNLLVGHKALRSESFRNEYRSRDHTAMARSASALLVQHYERLWGAGTVAGLTDRQLLEQFNAGRDPAGQAAFAALVHRHGPMVFGLCTKVLHDNHHAEDAFQAVFLVLARRAASIRDPDLLANWLYGVSLRTARHAKVRLGRHRKQQGRDLTVSPGRDSNAEQEMRFPSAEETLLAREQIEGLYEEIDRLPKAFRIAVVLRYFEGQTIDEIAGRLNWPVGTVRSRLARAREKLRVALARRGFALPVAALGWAPSQNWASAPGSSRLCDTTTVAAINFVAGRVGNECVAGTATSLARKVVQTMLLRRMAVVALALLLSVALVGGGSYVTGSLARTIPPEGPRVAPQAREQVVAKTDGDAPAPGRMFVTGRVLDPGGNPWRAERSSPSRAAKYGGGASCS